MIKREVAFVVFGLLIVSIGLTLLIGGPRISGNFILGSPVSGSIDSNVSRLFSSPTYISGQQIKVELRFIVDSSDKIVNYGIEEYVPVGWNVNEASISHKGNYSSEKNILDN
jgi:hypothetical protein